MKVLGAYDIKELNFYHLIQNIRGFLIQMRISQSPQLMYGKEMDLKTKFGLFLNL
jgi:hypothetical protein